MALSLAQLKARNAQRAIQARAAEPDEQEVKHARPWEDGDPELLRRLNERLSSPPPASDHTKSSPAFRSQKTEPSEQRATDGETPPGASRIAAVGAFSASAKHRKGVPLEESALRRTDVVRTPFAGVNRSPGSLNRSPGSLLTTGETTGGARIARGGSLTTGETTGGASHDGSITTGGTTGGSPTSNLNNPYNSTVYSNIWMPLTTGETTGESLTTGGASLTTGETTGGGHQGGPLTTGETTGETTGGLQRRITLTTGGHRRLTTGETTGGDIGREVLNDAPKLSRVAHFLLEQQLQNGGSVTPPLRKQDIARSVQNPPKNMAAAIYDMRRYGIIEVLSTKHGRGGGTVYRVPGIYHAEIIRASKMTSLTTGETTGGVGPLTTGGKLPGDQNGAPCSSRLKTTPTTDRDLARFFERVCSDYELGRWRTGANVLLDAWRTKLFQTPDDLRESVAHLVWVLDTNPRGIDDPAMFISGKLRKGYYAKPDGYRSPEENSALAKIESKKAEIERLQALEKENSELEYQLWHRTLTRVGVQQILGELSTTSALGRASLRAHWERLQESDAK